MTPAQKFASDCKKFKEIFGTELPMFIDYALFYVLGEPHIDLLKFDEWLLEKGDYPDGGVYENVSRAKVRKRSERLCKVLNLTFLAKMRDYPSLLA